MNYRVAVASSDGKVVNAHFGRTPQFLIFDITKNNIEFIELRENAPGCSNLTTPIGSMKDTMNLISDCNYIIVAKIGPGMVENLLNLGIQSVIIKNYISDALEELQNNYIFPTTS